MKKISIEQVEPRFARELETPVKVTLQKLGFTIPESFRLRVSFLQANGHKKRKNAGADTWAPESERMEFWLEPATGEDTGVSADFPYKAKISTVPEVPAAARAEASQSTAGQKVYVHPAEAELLRALDVAESTPGW